MKFAYADPPYIGQAKKHYSHDPNCAEVDHKALIETLCAEYSDGWALSLSTPSLKQILALCPSDVRIASWVKPFAIFKPNVNPGYTWEPVIWRGGRKRTRHQPTLRDWVEDEYPDVVKANITLKKGLCGAKPPRFVEWLFGLLNAEQGDTLVDLFPGTGIVGSMFMERFGGME